MSVTPASSPNVSESDVAELEPAEARAQNDDALAHRREPIRVAVAQCPVVEKCM